jgi:hypothetical protein
MPLPIEGGGGGIKGWFGGVDDTARASSGQGMMELYGKQPE